MTTESHRELGQHWLDNAIDWYSQIPDGDPWEKTTASALIAGVFFLAARAEDLAGEDTMARTTWFPIDLDDPFDGEEQHQSEKFEATYLTPRRELDEDNSDTLVGDAGLAGDDADTIARPLSSGGRVDFWDAPYPFGAA